MDHTDSMEHMYRKHSQMIYAFLLSKCGDGMLAEELTQETFYQAVKSLNSFKGQSSASTWLCGIANNVWLAHLRKQKRSGEIFSSDEDEACFASSSAESPEDKFFRKADNLVSEKTREIVDAHVARCPSCAKAVNEAKDSLKENFDCESVNYEGKDVDYLRKVRTSSRKKIIAGVCITLCLALVVYSCLTSPLNRAGSFSIPCSVNGKYLDVNGTRIMADVNSTPEMSLTAGSLSSKKQVILKSRRR